MIGFRSLLLAMSMIWCGCAQGNVCERQLEFEETECFAELEQPTMVDKEDCVDDMKAYAQCAMRNDDDYCLYYLWQNRGAARREGYTVSDTLAPNNSFVQCIDEAGLREK